MRKFFLITTFYFLILGFSTSALCQETKATLVDGPLKETLYLKHKKEVLAYSMKEYDALFFEFFQKQSDKAILTKEEYYTYTVKIAIYSEKHGLLYKDKKAEAQRTKQEWLDRNYQDYLDTKK